MGVELGTFHVGVKSNNFSVSLCRGYMAPEYMVDGQLSEKADIFSFGVLILEIISGRKIIDLSLRTSSRENLLELVCMCLRIDSSNPFTAVMKFYQMESFFDKYNIVCKYFCYRKIENICISHWTFKKEY